MAQTVAYLADHIIPRAPVRQWVLSLLIPLRYLLAANLNIHLHCRVLDGVYRIQNGVPEFHSVRSPTTEQLQRLLRRSGHKCGVEPTAIGGLCTYRIALGLRAGQKVLTLKTISFHRMEYTLESEEVSKKIP